MGVDAEIRVHTPEKLDARAVRKLAGDAAAAFPGFFWISRESDQHGLSIVGPENEDGYECIGKPVGGTLIKVETLSRYYGEGYERGPWPEISGVMRWLRGRLLGATVWYSGDSSDRLPAFTVEDDAAMWQHFVAVGFDPYHGVGQPDSLSRVAAPFCDFCQRPTWNSGGGGGESFWTCDGCGEQTVSGEVKS